MPSVGDIEDEVAPAPLPDVVEPPSPPPPLVVHTRHARLTSILAARFEELEAHVCAEHEAILQIVAGSPAASAPAEPGATSPVLQVVPAGSSAVSAPTESGQASPAVSRQVINLNNLEAKCQSCGDLADLPGTLNGGSEAEVREMQQVHSSDPSAVGKDSSASADEPGHVHSNGASSTLVVKRSGTGGTQRRNSCIRFEDDFEGQVEGGDPGAFSDVVPATFAPSTSCDYESHRLFQDSPANLECPGQNSPRTSKNVRNSAAESLCSMEEGGDAPMMQKIKSNASVLTVSKKRGPSLSIGRSQSEIVKLQRSFTKETGVKFMLSPVWEDLVCENEGRQSNFTRRSKTADLNTLGRALTSTTLVAEEEQMQEYDKKDWGIVQPNALKRLVWDLMGMILIIYDLIFIPMEFFEPPENTFGNIMNWVTRLFWTLDMPASMITGFFRPDGTLEMRFRYILRRYFRTWCLMDIIVNGSDWAGVFFGGSAKDGEGMKTVRVIRILRMVRLLRVLRMPHIFNAMAEHAGAAEFILTCDILKITSIFLAVTHLIACCWYAIGLQQPTGSMNWVQQQLDGPESADDLEYRYLTSLHWSVTQFIGSMEVRAYNWLERVFACMVLVFAFVLSASFVSSITSAMTRHHISATRMTQQLSTLRRYLNQNKISQRLLLRITRNAQFAMAEQQRNMPECDVELLQLVSDPLLMELHYELYAPWMIEHPFFELYSEEKPESLRKVCHRAFSAQSLSMGDVCFNVGEGVTAGCNMMFVSHGTLKYSQTDCHDYVSQGAYLCEGVLWTALWTHQGTLRATTDSKLYVMNASLFQDIAIHFEGDGDEAFSVGPYAQAYVEMVNGPEVELSDIGDNEASAQLVEQAYQEQFDHMGELSHFNSSHRPSHASGSSGSRPSRTSWRWRKTSSASNSTSLRSSHGTKSNKQSTWDVVTHSFSWMGRSKSGGRTSAFGMIIKRISFAGHSLVDSRQSSSSGYAGTRHSGKRCSGQGNIKSKTGHRDRRSQDT